MRHCSKRKTARDVRARDGSPLSIAAIVDRWASAIGQSVWQLATVTWAPSTDFALVHKRMAVLADVAGVRVWMGRYETLGCTLVRPFGEGSPSLMPAGGRDCNCP